MVAATFSPSNAIALSASESIIDRCRYGDRYCSDSLLLHAWCMDETNASPTVFRYVDWLLTVPLQIIEFYLILAAIAVVRAALFWKLLIGSP